MHGHTNIKFKILTTTDTTSYLPSTPGLAIYLLCKDPVAISDTNTTSERRIGKHAEMIMS